MMKITNIILARYYLLAMKPRPVHQLDKIGFILFGLGLALLTFGLSALSETTIQKWNIVIILLVSLVLLLLYLLHSYQEAHPVINTELFFFRTFRISALGNLFGRLSFGGIPFLIPLLLQICLGYSPQVSGFLLAPTALGVVAGKPISLKLLHWLGYRSYLMGNTVVISFILILFTTVNQLTPFFVIALFTFIFGFLSALQYTGMNSIAYSEIDQVHFSSATSIISTLQQVTQSFGVAMCAILIQFFSRNNPSQQSITLESLHHAFVAMGVLTLFSIVIFMRLKANDGAELLQTGER